MQTMETAPDKAQKLAMLRQTLADATKRSRPESVVPQRQMSSVTTVEEKYTDRERLAVPPALARLLPGAGLIRGTVVALEGARSLLLSLIAQVSADGGHVAVIGQPQLCLLAAAEMGADLSRIAVIPDPGPDPVEIAAVLLDGLDLVVVGLGGISVPPSRSRVVMARARSKGAVLVVTDGTGSGAHVKLQSRVCAYRHQPSAQQPSAPRRGYGRLGGVSLAVRSLGRGFTGADTRLDVVHCGDRVQLVDADEAQNGMYGGPSLPVAL
jgi:hypothetical protein